MDYTTLGRTKLSVSVLGLGAGGHSRLGQSSGATPDQSVAIVRRALELGVNFVDTAESYGTEPIIGAALQDFNRDSVVLSTKKTIHHEGAPITADDLRRGLEQSLRHLKTEHVEVYHLHGVPNDLYDYASERLVPVLQELRGEGKIRFLGITEAFGPDPGHRMMSRAVRDDCWDVVMVGFNILNQSARERVFPHTLQRQIGVLDMFAVRRAFSQVEMLQQTIADLMEQGVIDRDALDKEDPLGFLLRPDCAVSLADAAYRFCRSEAGVHVILSGTGNIAHLEENVASILRPPLPEADLQRLREVFARVDSVSGQ